jgi:hypothetical protein
MNYPLASRRNRCDYAHVENALREPVDQLTTLRLVIFGRAKACGRLEAWLCRGLTAGQGAFLVRSECGLPLRVPAILEPTTPAPDPVAPAQAPQPGEPIDPIREDADAAQSEVVYRGGPVQFERVVPASGNLAVIGSPGSAPSGPGSP